MMKRMAKMVSVAALALMAGLGGVGTVRGSGYADFANRNPVRYVGEGTGYKAPAITQSNPSDAMTDFQKQYFSDLSHWKCDVYTVNLGSFYLTHYLDDEQGAPFNTLVGAGSNTFCNYLQADGLDLANNISTSHMAFFPGTIPVRDPLFGGKLISTNSSITGYDMDYSAVLTGATAINDVYLDSDLPSDGGRFLNETEFSGSFVTTPAQGNGGSLQRDYCYLDDPSAALNSWLLHFSESVREAYEAGKRGYMTTYCYFADCTKGVPLISGGTKEIYVNVDSALSIEKIVTDNVTAKDLFGGNATVTINAADKAAYVSDHLGTYNVGLIATDSYGQTANATLIVHVVDRVPPVVTRKSALSLPYSQGLTYDVLKANYVVNDNSIGHGGSVGAPSFSIGGVAITAEAPYSFTAAQVGTGVQVSVSATDSSGYIGTLIDTITLKDDVAPVIAKKASGAVLSDAISVGLGIFANIDSAKAAFLSAFKATDAVDGDTAVTVTGFPADLTHVTIGNVSLTLNSVDKAGNKSAATVTMTIAAGAPPVFVLSEWLVAASVDCQLTSDEIKTIISNTIANLEGVAPASVTIDDTNYQEYGNRKTGNYEVKFSYVSGAKPTAMKSLLRANTQKAGALTIQVEGTDKTNWYDGIVDFFTIDIPHFFTVSIPQFFQRLGNWLSFRGWKTDAEIGTPINTSSSSTVDDSSTVAPNDSSSPISNSSSTSHASAGSGN